MSSKQKIAISVVGIILVLAIVGLTIGLVLTASTLTQSNSMTVSYSASNVSAKITASGTWYINPLEGSASTENIAITGGAAETTIATTATSVQGVTFANVGFQNPGDYAVYVFAVENTASTGGNDMTAVVTAGITAGDDAAKYEVVVAKGATAEAATTAAATAEEATQTATISATAATDVTYFAVRINIKDTSISSTCTANATITLTDVQPTPGA